MFSDYLGPHPRPVLRYKDILPGKSDACPCSSPTCPARLAQRKLASMQPRQAVLAAAKEDPTSEFMNQLAISVFKDVRYRRAGVVSMFLDHIILGKSSNNDLNSRRHWECSVHGIANILSAMQKDVFTIEDDGPLVQEIIHSHREIVEVLFKDLSFMRDSGSRSESRRVLASRIIKEFLGNPGTKKSLYTGNAPKVVLTCWLYSNPMYNARADICYTVVCMFGASDSDGNNPPPNALDVAFNSVKISEFVSQLTHAMKSKNMKDTLLKLELHTINKFIYCKSPFVEPILKGRLHELVMESVRRQVMNQADVDDEENWDFDEFGITKEILEETGLFLESDDTMATFTDLARNTCAIELGSKVLILAGKHDIPDMFTWQSFFNHIIHSKKCKNFEGCPFHATPKFLQAVKAEVEMIALPTVLALADEVDYNLGMSDCLDLWKELIKELEITESSIRTRYRVERKCSSIHCSYRNRFTRSEKKYTCSNCRSVFYCSRACQKDDWHIHKAECKKLAMRI